MTESYCLVDKRETVLLVQIQRGISEIKEADFNSIVNAQSVEIKKLDM